MEITHSNSAALYGDLDEYMMEDSDQIDSDEEDEVGRFGVMSEYRGPIIQDPARRETENSGIQMHGGGQTHHLTERNGSLSYNLRHNSRSVRCHARSISTTCTGLECLVTTTAREKDGPANTPHRFWHPPQRMRPQRPEVRNAGIGLYYGAYLGHGCDIPLQWQAPL